MSKKLVVVTGASGLQGGAAVRALLSDGQYEIRGVTRDLDKPASRALVGKGVEMVKGDPADLGSLVKAFEGAYAVFGVTMHSTTPGVEYQQGKNLVDACKAAGVEVFVWSSLTSVKETSNGKYNVTGFDEKADVDKYMKQVGQQGVVFQTGVFASNLLVHQLQKDPETSEWHLYTPWMRGSTPQYTLYVEKDLGPAVVAVVRAWGDEGLRKDLEEQPIPLVSYEISGGEKARIISEISGRKVTYDREEPTEGFTAHPMFENMFKWYDECFVDFGEVPPPILTKLGVKFHGFDEYVREAVIPYMDARE